MSIERLEIGPRMSQAVIHGDTVYLAGQVADDPSQPVADQTRQVLANVDRLLREAGSDRSRLLQVVVYLVDMADFATMNAVYDAWIDKANPPARACVQAALAAPEYKVEIVAIAAR